MSAPWIKPGDCIQGDCVEVRLAGDEVEVRDSKRPAGPVLRFDRAGWATAVAALKAGRVPAGVSWLSRSGAVRWERRGPAVTFTDDEWLAFVAGVWRGEFDVERLAAEASA